MTPNNCFRSRQTALRVDIDLALSLAHQSHSTESIGLVFLRIIGTSWDWDRNLAMAPPPTSDLGRYVNFSRCSKAPKLE